MCLGVPGKVARWIEREGVFARADVEFAGVCRVCHMACVTEVEEGEFVIVHAGIAISRIDEAEAIRLIRELDLLATLEEWARDGHPVRDVPISEAEGPL